MGLLDEAPAGRSCAGIPGQFVPSFVKRKLNFSPPEVPRIFLLGELMLFFYFLIFYDKSAFCCFFLVIFFGGGIPQK